MPKQCKKYVNKAGKQKYGVVFLHCFCFSFKVLVNIMYQRPRFNFTHGYFVESYQLECKLLEEKYKVIKIILDDHIQEQRHYTQTINRDEKRYYGMPGPMIPVQAISVNTSRPVLKDIFMLEFHSTISTIAAVPPAILKSHRELIHMFQPESITDEVDLELSLVSEISKEWAKRISFGNCYSAQTRKDIFSEIFIEDPMFVCEIGDSLTAQHDSRGILSSYCIFDLIGEAMVTAT